MIEQEYEVHEHENFGNIESPEPKVPEVPKIQSGFDGIRGWFFNGIYE